MLVVFATACGAQTTDFAAPQTAERESTCRSILSFSTAMNSVSGNDAVAHGVYAEWLESNAATQDPDIAAYDRAAVASMNFEESSIDADEAFDLGWGVWDELCTVPYPDVVDDEDIEAAKEYLVEVTGTPLEGG